MTSDRRDLLFEIGCEELPASLLDGALEALPRLARKKLSETRLGFSEIAVLGTVRRLTLLVRGLEAVQPDIEEQVVGPPVAAAFRDGQPTRAAEGFAKKLGLVPSELERVNTPKGEYVAGMRRQAGRPAMELLPEALSAVVTAIPFAKSMRWGAGTLSFGRPIRWLLALLGSEVVPLELAGVASGRLSLGHRFLHPEPIELPSPTGYVDALRRASVLVDPAERAQQMRERLDRAAAELGGRWIEDEFLLRENLAMAEDPQVIAGGFAESFLELPECVVLEVARGHQRYFCLRGKDDRLLPHYLAVVNTAERPEAIRLGNDRVMRARLSDAQFFLREDLKQALSERRPELGGIVFHNRLGSVLDKVERIERLLPELGEACGVDGDTLTVATEAAGLAKCDLVTLMVGELPELQGEVGRAYALRHGLSPEVADAIRDHYLPRGGTDRIAPSHAAALVAIADRLDTLVGFFSIGLSPTGAADPFGLRRACIGLLRTLLDRGLDLDLRRAFRAAYQRYAKAEVALDRSELELSDALSAFSRDRLRGLLVDATPADAVDAALGVAAERPLDARARALAIAELDAETRARVGEVFKRATNIAKEAPAGEPEPPEAVVPSPHPSEQALYDGFRELRARLSELGERGDYDEAFRQIAAFAPLLGRYFDDVYVMVEDEAVRDSRLRLMRAVSEACSTMARLELLAAG